ncbi:MAG: 1-acyl-sn-glycerol-3-phosphate acyltransferase [Clostridia bacterium]|nr:1-acyl-sn-glycerol-3-phosphate acyltransferase [Clostridia bacterium]
MMGIRFWNWFAKITAWPLQWLCFRTKVIYEDPAVQKRAIKGEAILISNHTSIFDYAVYLFVFFGRTLRFQMAEVLFEKPVLGWLLKRLGGIRVDRNAFDFGFVAASQDVLDHGGVVGIFPESRLPQAGEERPLPFKTSAAYIALSTGAPVIPVYTNGSYFNRHRARIVIGKPFYAGDWTDDTLSDKENIDRVTVKMRERIIELGTLLNE